MVYRHGNWKGLLQEVRKEMKRKPSSCERAQDLLPSYVDVYMSASPMKADRDQTYGLVRKHVNECPECREALETLMEMSKDPAALARDARTSPLPEFARTPEPQVPRPSPRIGTVSVSLKDQLGNLLWQHDRLVELRNLAPAFRAQESGVATLIDKIEKLVSERWALCPPEQLPEGDKQQSIDPVPQAYDMYVKEVGAIPEVSRVYALQYGVHEQRFVQIWAIVDEFSTGVCYPIYDIEFKVAAAFPGIQFDFSVIPDCGEETGSLVPDEADRLY